MSASADPMTKPDCGGRCDCHDTDGVMLCSSCCRAFQTAPSADPIERLVERLGEQADELDGWVVVGLDKTKSVLREAASILTSLWEQRDDAQRNLRANVADQRTRDDARVQNNKTVDAQHASLRARLTSTEEERDQARTNAAEFLNQSEALRTERDALRKVVGAARVLLGLAESCSHFDDEHDNQIAIPELQRALAALDSHLSLGGDLDNRLGSNRGTPPETPARFVPIETEPVAVPPLFWDGPWRYVSNLLFAGLTTAAVVIIWSSMVILEGWGPMLVLVGGITFIVGGLMFLEWAIGKVWTFIWRKR